MKKFLILTLATLVLVACKEQNTPSQGGGTTPSEEYIVTGYKLYSIPYTNKYYLWLCVGTKPNGEEDFFFNTVYSPKLGSSNIPYTYNFEHPVLLEDIQSYSYLTITVQYCATQEYGDGTQCLKQKLSVSDILQKKSEYILTSDNGKTKIGILMEYR